MEIKNNEIASLFVLSVITATVNLLITFCLSFLLDLDFSTMVMGGFIFILVYALALTFYFKKLEGKSKWINNQL